MRWWQRQACLRRRRGADGGDTPCLAHAPTWTGDGPDPGNTLRFAILSSPIFFAGCLYPSFTLYAPYLAIAGPLQPVAQKAGSFVQAGNTLVHDGASLQAGPTVRPYSSLGRCFCNKEMVYIFDKTEGNAVQIDGRLAWGSVWCVISPCPSSRLFDRHWTRTSTRPKPRRRACSPTPFVGLACISRMARRPHLAATRPPGSVRTFPLFSVWKLKSSRWATFFPDL